MKEYLKLSDEERQKLYEQFLREPDAFYEKAEMDQLRHTLKKSYTERFFTMTSLMKTGLMLSKAKITSTSSNKR